jgi:hypothetical protein
MDTIKAHDIVPLPEALSVCPICQRKLVITSYDSWCEDDESRWYAIEVHTQCESEPAIDSDNWDDWYRSHYSHPYIDWMPLSERILRWLKENYRFALT